MKYELTFENYGTCEKYTVEGPDVSCLQDAIEKLCATINNALVYVPLDEMDEETEKELQDLCWIYIDCTWFGGRCGYVNYPALIVWRATPDWELEE